MWRRTLIALSLVGCAQLPPSPQDIQAKKFEAPPDKAVIYIVRSRLDSPTQASIALGDNLVITTQPGTYYRWEVSPGVHRISGYAQWTTSVTLRTEPGKLYFVLHSVSGNFRDGAQTASLQQIGERDGRALVTQAQLL
jgi:hypothetical protein